jgi:hypothetical protein
MEMLSQKVGQSGGDIFKYAGDAMLILWTPPQDGEDKETYLKKSVIRALQTAVEIQEGLQDIEMEDDEHLGVKIGFGVGSVKIIYVGGVLQRAEFLPVGEPLTQAFRCEHSCPGGGYIAVPDAVKTMVEGLFEFEKIPPLESEEGQGLESLYFVKAQLGEKEVAVAGAN